MEYQEIQSLIKEKNQILNRVGIRCRRTAHEDDLLNTIYELEDLIDYLFKELEMEYEDQEIPSQREAAINFSGSQREREEPDHETVCDRQAFIPAHERQSTQDARNYH